MVAIDRATNQVVFIWRRVQGLLEKVYEVVDVRTVGPDRVPHHPAVRVRHDVGTNTFAAEEPISGGARLAVRKRHPLSLSTDMVVDCALSTPAAGMMVARLPVAYEPQARTYQLLHPGGKALARVQVKNGYSEQMTIHVWST